MNISKERLREIIEEEVANVEKEELSKVIEEGYTEAEMTPNYETDLEQALIGLVEVDGWPKDDVREHIDHLFQYIRHVDEGPLEEVIEKEKGKYVVKSEGGKTLGTHDTKKKARAQLGAIEASKKEKGD